MYAGDFLRLLSCVWAGLGFRVWGLGFGVRGSGFGAKAARWNTEQQSAVFLPKFPAAASNCREFRFVAVLSLVVASCLLL